MKNTGSVGSSTTEFHSGTYFLTLNILERNVPPVILNEVLNA